MVLSRETGHDREYGRNPYVGYDDINRPPFLYTGPVIPNALPPTARVVTVDRGGEAVAYPYASLEQSRVVNDRVGGAPLVVLWTPGTASALDEYTVAGGRDVGSAGVFSTRVDGRALTFRFDGVRIVDDQTGSEWNGLGRAVGGGLAGRQLEPVVAIEHFWFSWAAFRPQTRVHQP
ncbi:MAG: hypothetical protein AVDCRST_MAG88-2753 [uncultured Thermomicrobiales bacterium]|uniref:DUF3179 domain-containing protein n=1 Tax=uncultured Thermomicrobiales bacterium TaxID=1645740 RepID=A0A6J4VJ75_9BACT|nr:MAG: hypothetical protein AVDCRST_MAG88-2753 [uncultured Thermomicrobiales bacterium]